uniref:KRAB domain-containing protein n=1 Tax=Salvator merianae TaxID=96440 RepID=A0A8D0AZ93_SALMN
MEPKPPNQISLADVTVQFSQEEWQMLSRSQRQLYWEVTTDNFSSLSFL